MRVVIVKSQEMNSLSHILSLTISHNYSLLTSQIRIRVGEYDFSHIQEQLPYIERAVAKKVVHPKYNFFTYEYDLALVKLDAPLEFAPHIAPICLPATDDLLIGQNATGVCVLIALLLCLKYMIIDVNFIFSHGLGTS